MSIRSICQFRFSDVVAMWSLLAQNPTATLVGTVRDASGAVVVDAALEVHNTDTGETRKAATNEKGEFTVPNLVPGPYEVTIAKSGFRTVRETNIELQMDQVARMDFKLEVGAISQSIEVTDAAPLIATDNGTKGEVMTSAEMLEMPLNGRDFSDLAFLVPGVTPAAPGAQGSGIAINGAPGRQHQLRHRRLWRARPAVRRFVDLAQPRRHAGIQDADQQLLGRIRAHGRRRDEHGAEERREPGPRHFVRVCAQRYVRRAQLLRSSRNPSCGGTSSAAFSAARW